LCGSTKKPRPSPRCFGVKRVGRGDAKTDQHFNREPGDFVLAVAKVFSFREDWHQNDRALPLVRQYQLALDAVLRDRPDLQDCAVRCCHCRIRFLTHPRNARRQNLRCPFGCRQHHRRQRANQRTREYYRTAAGRRKKKRLNGKRSKFGSETGNAFRCDVHAPPNSSDTSDVNSSGGESVDAHDDTQSPPDRVTLPPEGFVLDEPTVVNSHILPYLLIVASLIEGRTICREELIAALRKRMRQHSIGQRPRREYVLRYLNQHPP
jgi:hypothetical protein